MNFRFSATAALALLAGCATTGKPPPSPAAADEKSPYEVAARPFFGGCEAEAEGQAGRTYACGAVDAWIINMGELEPGQALELGQRGAKEAMKGQMHAQPAKLKLAGKDWDAVAITNCPEAGDTCETGHIVAVQGPQGHTRFLGCAAKGQPAKAADVTRCRKMLDYFAQNGTPDGVELATLEEEFSQAPAPTLLSRTLEVPEGCEVKDSREGGGVIDCPNSMFFFAVVPQDENFQHGVDSALETMRARLPKVTGETRMPCILENQPGSCARLDGESEGKPLRVYVGQAKLPDGRGLLASCLSTEASNEFPPVCNGVFAVPK